MLQKLLIINKTQFGYHTDYYKYCEYLRNEFEVTYLCFDSGLKKLEMDNLNVKYVSNKGIKIIRGVRFILNTLITIANYKGIVFIHYFEKCQFLKWIFPKKKMILDIRTLSISPNDKIRTAYDKHLKKATEYFNFVTIISEGLRKKINLNPVKSAILPLGADVISTSKKDFNDNINLLYVGTLHGRNIHHTLIGLAEYFNGKKTTKKITYNIIGDGAELPYLKELVSKLSLEGSVKIHGRIPHFELKPFFDKCNVGVSYVPITDYYDFQPPTKTFEYILSGIPCIATNTYENRAIINERNGIICMDNPESFANALEEIIIRSESYNSEIIRQTLSEYIWGKIVRLQLIPVLKKV